MIDVTVIATAAISGGVGLTAALYGSPAAIAAIDQIQAGLAAMNQTDQAAADLFNRGVDAFAIAAREDVGPRSDDELRDVSFRPGIGPLAD